MAAALRSEHEHEARDEDEESGNLQELLAETRILLPGTEVFLAFLATIPFSNRFAQLERVEHDVYIATFLATMLSFVCFVTPTAYHRIARPIHHKAAFKRFANSFLVLGLAPVSLSVVLASFLITTVAVGRSPAYPVAGVMALLVLFLWWVIPLNRAHDRFARR